MTMELLGQILKENNIPKDVHFMSDSGWECDPTEMDGVFYNKQSNTLVFTQGACSDREYETSEEWEILYVPDLIKLEGLEIYPASSLMSFGITEEYKKSLKDTGDFEQYYGFAETEDKYNEIDLRWRPLFYSMKRRGSFIGYIGFTGNDCVLEPEIYIFKQYRNKGYGTRVLKKFMDIAFKDGLVKKWREKSTNHSSAYVFKTERVFPSKLVSTVRVENEYSQKMMLECGFCENGKNSVEFLAFFDDNEDTIAGFVEVRGYEITKEEYLRGCIDERDKTDGN